MQHTISYNGHTIGDKVWIWVSWEKLLTQVEIIGLTLNRYPDDLAKCEVNYSIRFVDSEGKTQEYTWGEAEVFDTRKAAIEAAIKSEEVDFAENSEMVQRQQEKLDWLKEQLQLETGETLT